MRSLGIPAVLILLASPALAGPEEDACLADLASARAYAETLPAGDLSRRFAEAELNTAETEMNGGETDECEPMVARARSIVRDRPFALRPGEALFGVAETAR